MSAMLRKIVVGTFAMLAGFGIFLCAPAPKADAYYSYYCYYSETLHVTNTGSCARGARHVTTSWKYGTHVGGKVFSNAKSYTSCWVADYAYSTITY